MKIKSTLFAAALALMAGVGAGFSGTASAVNPDRLECISGCFEARYECMAQCGGVSIGSGGSACAAACRAQHEACTSNCPV